MKLLAILRALGPLVALLVCSLAWGTQGQLAAYSETRSFRDALEGRSMEEAISGPVDKDTSSYGDRTADSASTTGSASSGPSTMMSIPANGNLNQQQQQQQMQVQAPADEQQQKSSGGELEREAGPIGPNYSMDTQPQMMRQTMRAKQERVARTGRLMKMTSAPNRMMGRLMQDEQQQQQQESPADEQQTSGATKQKAARLMGVRYGAMQSQAAATTEAYGQQQAAEMQTGYEQQERTTETYGQMAAGVGEQQMQQQQQQQQEKSYEAGEERQQMAAKQKMAAGWQMMAMDKMRAMRAQNYASSKPTGGQKAYEAAAMKPSGMAQSMMMSLANKAAYMANQRQQLSQRQLAPPMMQVDQQMGSRGEQQQMMPANGSGANKLMNSMRPMRRARQRKAEKKISPAMMNAMLNKMLAGRMATAEGQSQENASAMYGGSGRLMATSGMPMMTASNMMRTPMGAEMLANMMVMSANGAAQMSPAKKSQYKQMLMKAMLQQQTLDSDEGAYQQAGQSMDDDSNNKYGQRARPTGGNGAQAYGQGAMGSPMMNSYGQMADSQQQQQQQQQNMVMSMAARQKQSYNDKQQQQKMDEGQQQKMDSTMMGANYDGNSAATKGAGASPMSSMSYNGEQQQQQMMMTTRPAAMRNSYGNGAAAGNKQAQLMVKNKMYGQQGQEMPMEQQKQEMNAYSGSTDRPMDMPMNGFRQSYSGADQRQMQMEQRGQMVEGEKEQYVGQSQQRDMGTKSAAPSLPVSMSYGNTASNDGDDEQQQQQEQTTGQTKGDENYGDAAPMGQAEPFAFNYKTQDNYGNEQYRKEESDKNGVVHGSYGYMDQSGIFRHVEYVADENGFRANVKSNEPGLSSEQAGPSTAQDSKTSPVGGNSQSPTTMESPMPASMAGPSMGMAPSSSSSSLAGASGTGDASLRLQQQPAQQQQQQQQDTQLPMTPLMDMMQQALSVGQQQQYGGAMEK